MANEGKEKKEEKEEKEKKEEPDQETWLLPDPKTRGDCHSDKTTSERLDLS